MEKSVLEVLHCLKDYRIQPFPDDTALHAQKKKLRNGPDEKKPACKRAMECPRGRGGRAI